MRILNSRVAALVGLAIVWMAAHMAAQPGATQLQIELKTATGTDKLILERFLQNGQPLSANQIRETLLSPGVHEVIAEASEIGEFSLDVVDRNSYYGFGERFDRLDHIHTILKNETRNNSGIKGSDTYKPMPFFMSLRGYGLWVDTHSDAVFDLNVSEAQRIRITARAKKLRVLVFEGPDFPTILDRFTAQTGRAQLPPYWAFAPWKTRDFYRNDKEVLDDLDRYRKLGLPASVISIDSPWATNYNTYEFNPKQFADAPGMVRHLHDEGYKLVVWHTSWINSLTNAPWEDTLQDKVPATASPNFAEASAKGYLLKLQNGSDYISTWWKGTGGLIDFTNPDAKKWWQGQVAKAIAAGADGFKNDDAEGNFIGDVKFASGEDLRMVRNRYAVDYNRAVAEVLTEKKGKDWIMLQRSGTTGSHMLPFFWAGDNDASFSTTNGLPTVVTAGLNAGLSGISNWVSDLGGYNKTARTDPDPELFVRWTQYCALSPGMEMMTSYNWGPWDYGDEALRNFRQYSVLHMSLFPYRYAAAQESARNGLPILRALVLMHQTDPDARAAETQYYLGPDLLVAPILSRVTQREVYLPEGEWVDYWSGQRLKGRQTLTVTAAKDRIPLYVRAGAILPKIPDDVMTLVPTSEFSNRNVQGLDNRRVYEMYPGDDPVNLRDFEGRTLARSGNSLTITGDPAHVILRWRFGSPRSVNVDGRTITLTGRANGLRTVEFDHNGTSSIRWQ